VAPVAAGVRFEEAILPVPSPPTKSGWARSWRASRKPPSDTGVVSRSMCSPIAFWARAGWLGLCATIWSYPVIKLPEHSAGVPPNRAMLAFATSRG
jgi:hypothetical protein